MASPRELEEHFRRHERGWSDARQAREARERKLAHGLVERHRVRPGGAGQPALEVVGLDQGGTIFEDFPAIICTTRSSLDAFDSYAGGAIQWALARFTRPVVTFQALSYVIDDLEIHATFGPLDSHGLGLDWILNDDVDLDLISWSNRNDLTYGGTSYQLFHDRIYSGTNVTIDSTAQQSLVVGSLNSAHIAPIVNHVGTVGTPLTAYGCRIRWSISVAGTPWDFSMSGRGGTETTKLNSLKIFPSIPVSTIIG